jgi:magnesium-transporting ATPase (P-type)
MDKEYLAKPRKWDAKNIGRFMLWIGPTSSIFDITTFALMWYVFAANSVEMQTLFQSGWFIEGLLSQTLVVHMLRTRKIPFFQSTAAWPVLMMTCLVIVLGIYVPFSPLATVSYKESDYAHLDLCRSSLRRHQKVSPGAGRLPSPAPGAGTDPRRQPVSRQRYRRMGP